MIKIGAQTLDINLSGEQIIAYEAIVDWALTPFFNQKGMILSGYAGTGKTTLIREIVNTLNQSATNCVLCAPTNKAVKVLRGLGVKADFCTIYSLLGLEMKEHEDVLKLTKKERDRVGKYDIVILDECSMVDSQLFGYIQDAMGKYNTKFLFIGDEQQLNPVGEELSPIWGQYETYYLTEVMRHDNQILNFATHVRTTELNELIVKSDNDLVEGIWYLPKREFINRVKRGAKEFETNSKAIAWRNKTVESLNTIIRNEIHGADVSKTRWIVGDKVVFTSPHEVYDENDPKTTSNIITDEEAAIVGIAIDRHLDFPHLYCYFLALEFEDGVMRKVMAIHEESESKLLKELNMLAILARKDGKAWKDFWNMKRSVASMKHAYALTAHRAQGSTYENVYVDVDDILLNHNTQEAKRCLYVAATRPSKRLVMA